MIGASEAKIDILTDAEALSRRRAADIPESDLDAFLHLHWMAWQQGALRITPLGQMALIRIQGRSATVVSLRSRLSSPITRFQLRDSGCARPLDWWFRLTLAMRAVQPNGNATPMPWVRMISGS